MLAKLLKQDHRQKRRPGEAARRDMERRRRLRDRFALPTGEAFVNRLDHLPLTRDDLERLGDILASFESFVEPQQGQLCGAAITDPLPR
jgi:hypothetical protein